MSEHTRGPWTLDRFEDADDGGGEPWFRVSGDSTLFLTVAACADGYVPGQNEANARLIAAAPAYALAWSMVPAEIKERIFDALHSPDAEWVEAAIARAEGQS